MENLLDSVMCDVHDVVQRSKISPQLARAVKCFIAAVRQKKYKPAEFFASKIHIYRQAGFYGDDDHSLETWAMVEHQPGAIKILTTVDQSSKNFILNDALKSGDVFLLGLLFKECGIKPEPGMYEYAIKHNSIPTLELLRKYGARCYDNLLNQAVAGNSPRVVEWLMWNRNIFVNPPTEQQFKDAIELVKKNYQSTIA